jgi:hypothetical protein
MVIECKHVWSYISDYLDAALPEDIRLNVQKHLEHCEICSAILDSTRNIIILTADERVLSCRLASANACMRALTWNCKEPVAARVLYK